MKNTIVVKTKDTSLFTTLYPNTGKETVIFLHGGPGLPDGLTFIAEYLSEWFQVISFHQRGTLNSPTSADDFSMESYVSDIDSIAAHFHVEKFHLLGHSWGGLYAQIYAQHNPDRILSLFLCSPGSGTGIQWAETQAEIAKYNQSKSSKLEIAAMGIQAFLGGLSSDKGYQNLYKQLLKNFNKGFTVNTPIPFELECVKAKAINLTTKAILQYPLLRQFTDPGFAITVAYGEKDIYGDSKKYIKERYPSAAIHFISNSGHLSWAHHTEEFVKILSMHFKLPTQ
jgi:proline iminopeptidase